MNITDKVIHEKKTPHFISTEFKVQREMLAAKEKEPAISTSTILKGLGIVALVSTAFLFLNKKQKSKKKTKDALAYEVW